MSIEYFLDVIEYLGFSERRPDVEAITGSYDYFFVNHLSNTNSIIM